MSILINNFTNASLLAREMSVAPALEHSYSSQTSLQNKSRYFRGRNFGPADSCRSIRNCRFATAVFRMRKRLADEF